METLQFTEVIKLLLEGKPKEATEAVDRLSSFDRGRLIQACATAVNLVTSVTRADLKRGFRNDERQPG